MLSRGWGDRVAWAWLGLVACVADPSGEPDPGEVYPYVYTPETGLEDYHHVRWETGTWEVGVDLEETALYLLKSQHHRPSAPVESLEHFSVMRQQVPPLGEGLRLSFVGDVMWIGSNWASAWAPTAPLLDGDLRLGNLETPTSPAHATELGALGLYSFNAPTAMLDGLPLDVLQLNNNHSLDAGDAGLEATVAEVEARGRVAAGVDQHPVVEVAGAEVAVHTYTWGLNQRDAVTAHELFVVPFGALDDPIDLDGVRADLASSRAAGRWVVAMLHWGFEYEYYPDPHFMILARELVAAGADLVVGHGPHVAQPPEWCAVNRGTSPGIGACSVETDDGVPRDAAVLYSLGNFGTFASTVPVQTGLVVTASLGEGGVTGLGWEAVTVVQGADGAAVVPLAEAPDVAHADEADRLRAHLGAGWAR